jgi:drug/metabolite transporter (DMT)-like permease
MAQQKIFSGNAKDSHINVGTPARAFAALVLGNIAIAFGPLLVRYADTGPISAGFWRLALALPFLLYFAHRAGFQRKSVSGKMLLLILFSGFLFGLDILAWHLGIVKTKMANATVFGNCASLVLVIYGIIIARKLPGLWQAIATLLAFAGGALLMGQSFELSRVNLIGDILCLAGGILYAGYLLVMMRVRGVTESWGALTLSSFAAAATLLPAAILAGEQVMPGNWTPVLILALSSQVFGQGLLTYAIPHISPLVLGLALLLQPAISAVAGWIAFNEILSPVDFIGGTMVMAALILVRVTDRVR